MARRKTEPNRLDSLLDDLIGRELDRCERSFCALRAQNDLSPFGPRSARPKWRN
jgi:hypothetical protein